MDLRSEGENAGADGGAFGQCTSYAGDRIVSTVGRIALVKKSPKLFVKNY
jgi:hypothetical protein